MENANLLRSLTKTFYSMTRRYGSEGYLYRITDAYVNRDTGEKVVETERRRVRNLVHVPVSLARSVIYTPAMMQSIRSTAWQGGGTDDRVSTFVILRKDCRLWGEIEPDQWIRYNDKSYQISAAQEMAGGWLIEAKLSEGSGPAENND